MDTSAWLRERRLERYEQPLQEHETDPEVLPGAEPFSAEGPP